MTRAGGPFFEETDHPTLLLWYAAGTVDAWTAQRIEEHLRGCSECREEHAALVSMSATLGRHAGTDHVAAIDLVDYEAGALRDRARFESIRRHLEGCAECRGDARTVAEARREGDDAAGEAVGAPARTRAAASAWWRPAFLAAAAVILVLLVPAWRGLFPRAGRSEPRAIQPVRLMAQTRAGGEDATLAGQGPWLIEIALPFGAPDGDYDVRIAPRGAPQDASRLRARADTDGLLRLLVPALSRPDVYDVTATSVGAGGKSYPYAIRRRDAE